MAEQGSAELLNEWIHEYENDPEFIAESLASDVTNEAIALLGDRSQTWLANQMHVSRSYVSNIFRARPNLTLLSIARLAVALGVRPKVILDSGNYVIVPATEISGSGTLYERASLQQSYRFDAQSTENIVAARPSVRYTAASS